VRGSGKGQRRRRRRGEEGKGIEQRGREVVVGVRYDTRKQVIKAAWHSEGGKEKRERRVKVKRENLVLN
jgi:hypothetical protein